jgi:hypothetical protein
MQKVVGSSPIVAFESPANRDFSFGRRRAGLRPGGIGNGGWSVTEEVLLSQKTTHRPRDNGTVLAAGGSTPMRPRLRGTGHDN